MVTNILGPDLAQKVHNTEEVLKSISQHLAIKPQCRNTVYRVAIGVRDAGVPTSVTHPFTPDDSIFFDINTQIYEKHWSGKRMSNPVINHIMFQHFKELLKPVAANGNQVQLLNDVLIHGVYEYTRSTSGKYRRWVRVK